MQPQITVPVERPQMVGLSFHMTSDPHASPHIEATWEAMARDHFQNTFGFPPSGIKWYYEAPMTYTDDEGEFEMPERWVLLVEGRR